MAKPNTNRARNRAQRLASAGDPFAPAAAEMHVEPPPTIEVPPLPAVPPLTTVASEEIAALATSPVPQGSLAQKAWEINERLALADRLDTRSQDHRLAAALLLAKARRECKDCHINFMRWAEANVPQARRTILLLASVGDAPDPRAALLAVRARTAAASAALRARQRSLAGQQAAPAAVAEPGPALAPPDAPAAVAEPDPAPPGERSVTVESVLADYRTLSKSDQREFMKQAIGVPEAPRRRVA